MACTNNITSTVWICSLEFLLPEAWSLGSYVNGIWKESLWEIVMIKHGHEGGALRLTSEVLSKKDERHKAACLLCLPGDPSHHVWTQHRGPSRCWAYANAQASLRQLKTVPMSKLLCTCIQMFTATYFIHYDLWYSGPSTVTQLNKMFGNIWKRIYNIK